MKIISVHSVFSGVGKTLVALSSVVQLANLGFKTALIELIHDGAVLEGWLDPILPKENIPNTADIFGKRAVTLAKLDLPQYSVKKNLFLGLVSPDPKDIRRFNNLCVMALSGASDFYRSMRDILQFLRTQEFKFVFIDSHAEVSFLSGINISFMLEQAFREQTIENPDTYGIWFGCRLRPQRLPKPYMKWLSTRNS